MATPHDPTHKLVTQLACYALIASAFVLAGLLLTHGREGLAALDNTADAALLVNRDDITLMTAQTRSGEESLFVLDNRTERLFVYRLDVNRNRMIPAAVLNLTELFSTPSEQGGQRR
ncbi:hypothetical protein [Mucisphaera sp.]|uniref:hypothetical protein n=1 Tax=Mucisphaera sp. TaxID=2913024 RepID=UPI003D1292FC